MAKVGADKSRLAVAAETVVALGMTVVVKSAGNGGPGLATMTAPAEADGIIVVGATDRDGMAVQDYSSRGPALVNSGPHLVAPGGSSAEPIAAGVVGGVGYLEPGTSFAVLHVTGAVALILERRPDAEPDDVLEIFREAARPLPGTPLSAGGSGIASDPRLGLTFAHQAVDDVQALDVVLGGQRLDAAHRGYSAQRGVDPGRTRERSPRPAGSWRPQGTWHRRTPRAWPGHDRSDSQTLEASRAPARRPLPPDRTAPDPRPAPPG